VTSAEKTRATLVGLGALTGRPKPGNRQGVLELRDAPQSWLGGDKLSQRKPPEQRSEKR